MCIGDDAGASRHRGKENIQGRLHPPMFSVVMRPRESPCAYTWARGPIINVDKFFGPLARSPITRLFGPTSASRPFVQRGNLCNGRLFFFFLVLLLVSLFSTHSVPHRPRCMGKNFNELSARNSKEKQNNTQKKNQRELSKPELRSAICYLRSLFYWWSTFFFFISFFLLVMFTFVISTTAFRYYRQGKLIVS